MRAEGRGLGCVVQAELVSREGGLLCRCCALGHVVQAQLVSREGEVRWRYCALGREAQAELVSREGELQCCCCVLVLLCWRAPQFGCHSGGGCGLHPSSHLSEEHRMA